MSDSTKVRLVRCPKCENLLPELEGYSVYQCGGCGAVLRAKSKNQEADSLSEKSGEEKVAELSAISHKSSEKGTSSLSDTSDTDKSNAGSSRPALGAFVKNDNGLASMSMDEVKGTDGIWVVDQSVGDSSTRVEEGNVKEKESEIEHENLKYRFEHAGGSHRSGRMEDWRTGERGDIGGLRFSTPYHADEGPSNYHSDSSKRNQFVDQDRAELLRKLDLLKEQLISSCNLGDKQKEKIPIVPPDPYGSLRSENRASMPLFGPNQHFVPPPYYDHAVDPFPYMKGHEMGVRGLHQPMLNSNVVPRYGDPFQSRILGQYQQPPSHAYFPSQHIGANQDMFDMYQQNAMFHQPSCSCYHCYDRQHQRVPQPVQPTAFANTTTNNHMMYRHENFTALGQPRGVSGVNNYMGGVPPPNSQGVQTRTRWPSGLTSEMGGVIRPQRVVVAASGARRCRPVAGGAPLIICNSCFELVQLPKKAKLSVRNQLKLQCGSCSTIINSSIIDKKLVVSDLPGTAELPLVDDSSNEAVKDYASRSHGRFDSNFSFEDYDNSGYDFQAMDSNVGKPHETQSVHSSSPSISEDESSPDVTNPVQQPIKANLSPPPPGSPLQEHFDYSSNNHAVVNRFSKGNRSSRSDHDKSIPNRVATRQNSLKEATLATETEVSVNDYSNAGMSQDSGYSTREDNVSRNNKGSESFFANIKKSFKDLSRSSQAEDRGRSYVSINGHFIPERLVKKAEKTAGSIRPGKYWYDYQAGFWGVIGGPCLGIIPPFIEELNYPLLENCAGGTTGVFVNGRELHQKDLDLLASRGLPTTRDRSYIVKITGEVWDEDTGEELDGLGKLAPTVEKLKRGFGMKVPRGAAA